MLMFGAGFDLGFVRCYNLAYRSGIPLFMLFSNKVYWNNKKGTRDETKD